MKFNAKQCLVDMGADPELVNDWFMVRKTKKATNTATAMRRFNVQVEKSGLPLNEVLEICCEHSWSGFNHEWVKNIKRDDTMTYNTVFE